MEGASHSSYDALQVRLEQRFARGFTLLSAFSYEKSIDNGSGVRPANGDQYTPQDVYNLAADRGLSAFNFGYRLVNSFLYELPFGKGKAMMAARTLLRRRFSVAGNSEASLPGRVVFLSRCIAPADRLTRIRIRHAAPMRRASVLDLSSPSPTQWFNPAAFVNRLNFVPGVGPYRFGNSGRNVLIGPGIVEFDASLQKSFSITERAHLDFRSEFFNLPNHPILGQPGTTLATPSYGVIGGTDLPSRQIQFALKLRF